MRIFKDKELMEEISILELGIVPAGEVKRFDFWVMNENNAFLKEILFTVEHQEVEVIEAPTELSPQEVNQLTIEWSPSITLKEGLKASLRYRATQLWG